MQKIENSKVIWPNLGFIVSWKLPSIGAKQSQDKNYIKLQLNVKYLGTIST